MHSTGGRRSGESPGGVRCLEAEFVRAAAPRIAHHPQVRAREPGANGAGKETREVWNVKTN